LRTGDVGYRDAAGHLYVVDRIKDMIITSGYNVYPAEVERVVAEHPDVALVAVAAQSTPTADDIIEFCRDRLAASGRWNSSPICPPPLRERSCAANSLRRPGPAAGNRGRSALA
jgi:acyl-CoA synthetase (AMP-forming)/AMP-acid ligase II